MGAGMASGLAERTRSRQYKVRPVLKAANYTHIGARSHVAVP